MQSGNPVLNSETFKPFSIEDETRNVMTLQGTMMKVGLMLLVCVCSAAFIWYYAANAAAGLTDPQAAAAAMLQAALPFMIGGVIVGLITALVVAFKPAAAPIGTPIYAVAEGLFIGGLSGYLETMLSGIVVQAVGLTFAVFAIMLFLYSSRIIKVTQKLRMGIVAATGGIMLFYVVAFVGSLLGFTSMSSVLSFENGSMLSIGVSVFIVAIASFNLLLDFDLIEQGTHQGAPKHMEWFAAFALLVTLVWLYIEILRLLAKLRSE